ncbi:hypothetical protein B0H11DRAFT_2232241 [Mycena galericulata]|nr:hypothetical protein B0H11DRAFT_2232241 [Mycena galericulata]
MLNAGRFLDNKWIDIPALRDFLTRNVSDAGHDASSARLSPPSASIPIKIETSERLALWEPAISVKPEPQSTLPPPNPNSIKVRTLYEGGREVLELQSNSEVEDSDIEEVSGELNRAVSRSSSIPTPCDQIDADGYDGDLHTTSLGPADEISTDSDDELSSSGSVTSGEVGDSGDELLESDTVWPDAIKLYVRIGNYEITQKLKNIKRIEYINELPSIYPQFREQTVIVVNLSASKFNIENKTTDQLYTIDYLIRNDNDSYISHGSDAGSSTALVTFVPGEEAIEC